MPHVSCLMYHLSCIMPHVSCLMHHLSCIMPHASCLMHHVSCIMPHASCLMHHLSCIMPHASCLMHHGRPRRAASPRALSWSGRESWAEAEVNDEDEAIQWKKRGKEELNLCPRQVESWEDAGAMEIDSERATNRVRLDTQHRLDFESVPNACQACTQRVRLASCASKHARTHAIVTSRMVFILLVKCHP